MTDVTLRPARPTDAGMLGAMITASMPEQIQEPPRAWMAISFVQSISGQAPNSSSR